MTEEPRPVDIVLETVRGTWKTDIVTLDDVERVEYKDFTVTFSGNENDDVIYFTTTGRPELCDFPEFGSLKLGTDIKKDFLVMPGGWGISYWVHDSQLEMAFGASQRFNKPQEGPNFIFPLPVWNFILKR